MNVDGWGTVRSLKCMYGEISLHLQNIAMQHITKMHSSASPEQERWGEKVDLECSEKKEKRKKRKLTMKRKQKVKRKRRMWKCNLY